MWIVNHCEKNNENNSKLKRKKKKNGTNLDRTHVIFASCDKYGKIEKKITETEKKKYMKKRNSEWEENHKGGLSIGQFEWELKRMTQFFTQIE